MSLSEIKFQKYNIFLTKLFNLIISLNSEQQQFLLKKAEELFFSEKREDVRKDCRIPVRYVNHNGLYNNFIVNICRGGCFIETQKPFFIGEKILMDIQLDGSEEPIRTRGEVAHVNRLGIGVEFKETSTNLSELLIKLI